jgi:hypothetical protein
MVLLKTTFVAGLLAWCQGAFGQSQAPLLPYGGAEATKRPNVVFILTDDQDLHLNSLEYTPLTRKHLQDRGTFFSKHFVTIAVCCPSRVSLWTGKTAHNTVSPAKHMPALKALTWNRT